MFGLDMLGLEGMFTGMIQEPTLILFFGLFFLFILLAYKVVKMLVRALIIAVLSGLFPVFANMFLGMSIPVTIDSVLWYAMTGAEIYFVYHIIVSFGKLGDMILKPFRGKGSKTKTVEKVIIMEKGKDKHDKEKE